MNSSMLNKHSSYVLNFIVLLAFLLVLGIIAADHSFFGLNEKIFSLIQSNFGETYQPLMMAITTFGNFKVIFLTVALTSLWFIYKKQWRTLVFWITNLIIACAITLILKDWMAIPRPPVTDPADIDSLYSFPSGHVSRVVLILSYFVMLIAPYLSKFQRNINFFIAGVLIILMSLSRLLLDAHWLSDVIGSIFLGLTCSMTVFSFYQRKAYPALTVKPLVLVFSGSWLLSWAVFYLLHLK